MSVNSDSDEEVQNPAILAVTIEEAITLTGFGVGNGMTAAVGGLGIVSTLIGQVDISYALPMMDNEFSLSDTSRGFLTSAFFLGTIFSCHLSGFLSDTLGRRYVLIRSLSANFVLYLLATVLPGYESFAFAKFFSGFFVCGASISSYAYLVEMQPSKQRNVVFMAGNMLKPITLILIAVLALLVIPGTWHVHLYASHGFTSWRLYYFLCGLPSLFTAVLVSFTPESPKYLAATGQIERMFDSLQAMHRLNHLRSNKEVYPDIIIVDPTRIGQRRLLHCWDVVKVSHLLWTQTVQLFRKPFLVKTSKICSFSLLSFVGMGFGPMHLPMFSVLMRTYNADGNRTICEVARQEANPVEMPLMVYYDYMLAALCQLIAMLLIIAVIRLHLVPVKLIICLYMGVCTLSSLAVQWTRSSHFVIVLVASFLVFGASAFSACLGIFTQLYPTRVRGTAVCMVVISFRLGSAISNILMANLLRTHCHYLFSFFFVVLGAGVAIFLTIPKPKAIPIRDIVSSRSTSTHSRVTVKSAKTPDNFAQPNSSTGSPYPPASTTTSRFGLEHPNSSADSPFPSASLRSSQLGLK